MKISRYKKIGVRFHKIWCSISQHCFGQYPKRSCFWYCPKHKIRNSTSIGLIPKLTDKVSLKARSRTTHAQARDLFFLACAWPRIHVLIEQIISRIKSCRSRMLIVFRSLKLTGAMHVGPSRRVWMTFGTWKSFWCLGYIFTSCWRLGHTFTSCF